MNNDQWSKAICLVLMALASAFLLGMYTTYCYRPVVTKWTKAYTPYQAKLISVPRRIMWNGVEYQCELVRVKQPDDGGKEAKP